MLRGQLLKGVALIAPPRCAGCGRTARPDRWICESCREDMLRSPAPPGAAFIYEGTARRTVAALKFNGATALAREMAGLMLLRCPELIEGADWIVPVPAHPSRARLRGYNQSRLLAAHLAALTRSSCVDCLVRPRGLRPQSELSRADRLALPRSAIRAHPLAEFPTNVVLCDDVSTTGVTLDVCVQAIRERLPETGHRQIRAVTFASTPTHGTTDRIARRQSRRTRG